MDASQEMFTLGICNIFGSFVRSIPTCGAFTRSAVSNASGVRTPMAGLYSGNKTASSITVHHISFLKIFTSFLIYNVLFGKV